MEAMDFNDIGLLGDIGKGTDGGDIGMGTDEGDKGADIEEGDKGMGTLDAGLVGRDGRMVP